MRWRTALRLGRVSNLPTVWTNALAGIVLAGGGLGWEMVWPWAGAGLALSLFYTGGMWLNDAFDARIDAAERAGRPIPAGEASRGAVFAGGGAMLAGGVLVAFALGPAAGFAGLFLAANVVLYDALHKRTVLSPVIMGSARFLSYILAALAVASAVGPVLWGALGLFAYVIGLTYAAKQEAYDRIGRAWPLGVLAVPLLYAAFTAVGSLVAFGLWLTLALWTARNLRLLFLRRSGDVPTAVVGLIAGIALYDAVLVAAISPGLGMLAALGFLATLALQRLAPGT